MLQNRRLWHCGAIICAAQRLYAVQNLVLSFWIKIKIILTKQGIFSILVQKFTVESVVPKTSFVLLNCSKRQQVYFYALKN